MPSCTTKRRLAGITCRRRTLHRLRPRWPSLRSELNARAVAAWSAACIFIVLSTTNPVYKAAVLAAALCALAAGAGLRRLRGLLIGVLLISAFAVALNFVSAHLGTTVLFALPDEVPALGGPY